MNDLEKLCNNKPQKYVESKKWDTKEWVHSVWFLLYEVHEQVKLIYGIRN